MFQEEKATRQEENLALVFDPSTGGSCKQSDKYSATSFAPKTGGMCKEPKANEKFFSNKNKETKVSKDQPVEDNLEEPAREGAYLLKSKFPGKIKITSGRRDKVDQSRAMAGNVINIVNKKIRIFPRWIIDTYSDTSFITNLQKWIENWLPKWLEEQTKSSKWLAENVPRWNLSIDADKNAIENAIKEANCTKVQFNSHELDVAIDVAAQAKKVLQDEIFKRIKDKGAAELINISRHLAGLAFDIAPIKDDDEQEVKDVIASLPKKRNFFDNEGGKEV